MTTRCINSHSRHIILFHHSVTAFVPNDGCLNFIDENDEVLISGFGRKGKAKGDIPGVRFKCVKVSGCGLLALWKEKKVRIIVKFHLKLWFTNVSVHTNRRSLDHKLSRCLSQFNFDFTFHSSLSMQEREESFLKVIFFCHF
jgi:hypothetical protein